MTEGQIRAWLKNALAKRGAPTAFAKRAGLVDETVLSFLRGARPLEPGLGRAIGFHRVVTYAPCPCYGCTKARTDLEPGHLMFGEPVEMQQMFLCETCGNKRCPHAADHENECTGSNEPGQAGSLYEALSPSNTGGPSQ
jgi:hypothetical protein